MRDTNTDTVPLAQVLLQLAKELSSADLQIKAMETVLQHEELWQVLSARQVSTLQGFDHVRQTLACLELFLVNLADNTDAGFVVNANAAAEALTLNALSKRLSDPSLTNAAAPKTGSFHLF